MKSKLVKLTKSEVVYLTGEFLSHDLLGVFVVQVSQVDKGFTHCLVEIDRIRVLKIALSL